MSDHRSEHGYAIMREIMHELDGTRTVWARLWWWIKGYPWRFTTMRIYNMHGLNTSVYPDWSTEAPDTERETPP